jgi:predicted glycogen debranching enzyme
LPLPDEREWLVTNGLGGYASGTVVGTLTRRFHGLLIAALPTGRTMLLNRLEELGAWSLVEFRLDAGLPVWRYAVGAAIVEKRVAMVRAHDTVQVTYTLLTGGPLRLRLRPGLQFRAHDGRLDVALLPYHVEAMAQGFAISSTAQVPVVHVRTLGAECVFRTDPLDTVITYATERARGYDATGSLHSPGVFEVDLVDAVTFVASTESHAKVASDLARRSELTSHAYPELALAADQFVIGPERTVIAGYPWFGDWGRDTMISLEGLTLVTGRYDDAAAILRSFGRHVRDGLIPNLFPEGTREGLYHTADASLWFVHAVSRYVHYTEDSVLLADLLPALVEILDAHLRGTRFGIAVDKADGLLRQGEAGYQLTWMDAKMGDWVVTPRRGKAVEINALFYHALRVVAAWAPQRAARYLAAADRAYASFNARFWFDAGQHLYDVVDADDSSCRPNQLLAISLPHPVLDPARWQAVFDTCRRELATPVGLRTLSPRHPDYQPRYEGDLRARDGAYHQGTVWPWLIGPYVDAWRKVYPQQPAEPALAGLLAHLHAEGCVGSISEIFDAEPPHTPRGCIAQAWSVAEVLRVLSPSR